MKLTPRLARLFRPARVAPTGPARRAPRRKRAAVAVGVGLVGAVLLQAGLGLAAELSLYLRDPGYADKELRLRKQFAARPGAPSVVMLGTSRTGYGFYSARIREQMTDELGGRAMAFNFGIPASGPVGHLTYLRRLLADGHCPDLLLVEVLPPTLAELSDGPLEARFLHGERLRRHEVEPVIGYGFPAAETRTSWVRSVVTPWHALRFPIMGRVNPSSLPWHLRYDWSRTEDPAGWTTPMVTELTPAQADAGLKRATGEYGAILADLHPTGGGARALADLLALCRVERIAVRLVLMPESEGFRALYLPATTERLYAFLAKLEADHGAPLVDARGWLPATAFTDGHHMLRPGAEAFSDRLVREAILPFFRGADVPLAPSLFRRLPLAALRPGWRRASKRRRAAGSVLTGIALALAAQVALGVAIRAEVSPLRDPVYFDKFAVFRKHPAFFPGPAPPADRPTTVLFVGSSRTLNAVNARRATADLTSRLGRPVEVFNFGQAGAGPVTNAVYFRRTQDGVKADFVLVEVHPVFLAGQHPAAEPETRWLLPTRLRPDELPVVRDMGFPAAEPAVHGARGLLAPAYEFRFLLLDRYAPFLLMDARRLNGGHEPDDFGFARPPDHSTPEQRAALTKLSYGQYADYFAGYRPTGCGVNALRSTLTQCRALGARAALVLMPECGGWERWYDAEGLRQLDAVVAGLAAEFGVPVLDTRRWVTEDETMDGHHLTGLGADRFTDVLARDALAPWLGGPR